MNFDPRTAGILSAFISIMLGAVMAVYYSARRVYPGFGRWMLADIIVGMGILLISLRDIVSDFLSIIVGNLLLVLSILLIIDGLLLFFGLHRPDKWNYAIFGFYAISLLCFTYVVHNINLRIVVTSFVLVYFHVYGIWILWRHAPGRMRFAARSAASVFLLTALLSAARGVRTLGLNQPAEILSGSYLFWYSLGLLVAIIGWTFCFFFLNSARLEMELEDAHQEMTRIADTDPLTNVYNRRHFIQHAETEFQHALRSRRSLSFMEVDVDHFKSVNDMYGHDVGDAVQIHLSKLFRDKLRVFDILARFGGDEYFIMLMDTDEAHALTVASRIREAVEFNPFVFDDKPVHVTVTIGLSACKTDDTELSQVLKRVDTAMYRAKNEGRNRVIAA